MGTLNLGWPGTASGDCFSMQTFLCWQIVWCNSIIPLRKVPGRAQGTIVNCQENTFSSTFQLLSCMLSSWPLNLLRKTLLSWTCQFSRLKKTSCLSEMLQWNTADGQAYATENNFFTILEAGSFIPSCQRDYLFQRLSLWLPGGSSCVSMPFLQTYLPGIWSHKDTDHIGSSFPLWPQWTLFIPLQVLSSNTVIMGA